MSQPVDPKDDLKEGADFYWENGRKVLTSDYLHRRGYCCESGCRHCPYGYGTGVKTMPDGRKKPSIET